MASSTCAANRYSVPDHLTGSSVMVRIGLDDLLRVYHDDQLVVSHQLRPASEGWVTRAGASPAPLGSSHAGANRDPLTVYEEVGQWS